VTDAAAAVLGRFAQNDLPALARKDLGTHRVVFSASPGLPAELLRQLAIEAGVHIFAATSGDAVDARGSALSIHAGASGTKTITLPAAASTVVANTRAGEQTLCSDCSSVTLTMSRGETVLLRLAPSSGSAGATSPIGWLDSVADGVASGWACDPDQPSASIPVHLYVGGPAGSGALVYGVIASMPNEGAVTTACGGGTAHRFKLTIPNWTAMAGKPVHAYGVDLTSNPNAQLAGSPRTLPAASGPGPSAGPNAGALYPAGLFRDGAGGYLGNGVERCSFESGPHLVSCGFTQADYDGAPQHPLASLKLVDAGLCTCPQPKYYGLFREGAGGYVSLKSGYCMLTSSTHLSQCGFTQADYDSAPHKSTGALGASLGACQCGP